MPRILFISHSGGLTGAPVALLHLTRWIADNTEHDIRILLKEGGELHSRFAAIAPVTTMASSARRAGYAWIKTLFSRLNEKEGGIFDSRKNRYDLIYSNTITNGDILEELSDQQCPVITHVHEMSHWIELSGADNLLSVKRHTTRFIAASHAVRDNLVRNYEIPEDRIDVVHEFIATDRVKASKSAMKDIRSRFGIRDDQFVVAGSGFETYRKGKDLFVELAKQVVNHSGKDEIHFVWVGGWEGAQDKSRIYSLVAEYSLEICVHFVGEVDNPHDYFGLADVFAMVSREDPYPLVCLEAAALECPVVCFADAGGMPEFVEKDAGFVVPFTDVDEMAKKIVILAGNKELKEKLGLNAAKKVRDRHDVSVGGREIVKIIERSLGDE